MNASSNQDESGPLFNSAQPPLSQQFDNPAAAPVLPPSIGGSDFSGAADPFINLSDISEPLESMPNTFLPTQANLKKFTSQFNSPHVERSNNDPSNSGCGSESAAEQPQEPPNTSLAPAPVFSPLRSADEIHATLNEFRDILDSIESGNRIGTPSGSSSEALDQVEGMLPVAPIFPGMSTADDVHQVLNGYRGILDNLQEISTPELPHVSGVSDSNPITPGAVTSVDVHQTLDGYRGILDAIEENSTPATPQVSTAPEPSFPSKASPEQIYEKLNEFRGILDVVEGSHDAGQTTMPATQSAQLVQPAVEFIETPQFPIVNAPSSGCESTEKSQEFQNRQYAYVTPPLTLEKSILDSLFEIGNIAASNPIVALEPASENLEESSADVRDYLDSSLGQVTPIPGSCDLPPETFDFQAMDAALEAESLQAVANSVNTATHDHEQAPSDAATEVFLAKSGDVIEIDGNLGFDHIDLKFFDVKSASFSENCIKIEDHENPSFEIHHRNIQIARFANNVEVDLFALQQ